jgi:hypothetical protein
MQAGALLQRAEERRDAALKKLTDKAVAGEERFVRLLQGRH